MRVKKSERAGLSPNIKKQNKTNKQKPKIMASGPITDGKWKGERWK